MLTLIAAAAVAAAQTAAAPADAQHPMPMMEMGQGGEHKGMDCCKECSEHMAKKHEGEAASHAEHKDR